MPKLFLHEAAPTNPFPLIFLHGFPGSHAQAKFLEPYLHKFQLRLLAPDRPGYGDSAPALREGLSGFVSRIETALAERKINKFYILGVSGGTPSAFAIAHHFGPRVKALGIVSGLGYWRGGQEGFGSWQTKALLAARYLPPTVWRALLRRALANRNPEEGLNRVAHRLHGSDQAVLLDPKVRPLLLASIRQALKQGPEGVLFDGKSFAAPWWKEGVTCPVRIWHGENDQLLSVDMARATARRVPHAVLRTFPGEGHYSLPIRRAEELLTDLIGANRE